MLIPLFFSVKNSQETVLAILWGPEVLTPSISGSGGPNVHEPPLFRVMLLYMACNP